MRHFVFKIDGKYELVYSTSLRQAEKDMCSTCIAAFISEKEAEIFVGLMNLSV